MRATKLTSGQGLYGLAFVLALGVRLIQLGAAPLADAEAGWALQALDLAHGKAGVLGAQPAYILLTSQLFSIFGDTNFLVRFIPALAGSLVVWLPYLFRHWAGDSRWMQRAGLVMAFGLALDPGLVSLSRQAGSLMPALAFTLLALGFFQNRSMVFTGIFAGLALLSGPAFLQGLLILGISLGIYRQVTQSFPPPEPDGSSPNQGLVPLTRRTMGITLAAFAGTLLVAGTLFLRAPQGIGALAATIPAYLHTWVTPGGIPILRLPASLLVYQPLVIIFGVMAAVSVWFKRWDYLPARRAIIGLEIFAAAALLLPLLYAGRQVGDMAWVLIPLWALAGIEISRSLLGDADLTTRVVAICLVVILFVLAAIDWINLLKIGRYQVSVAAYWMVIIGGVLLGLIAVMLVATTVSTYTARLGVAWAAGIILGLLLLSNAWGVTIVRPNSVRELWTAPPAAGQAGDLLTTLSDFSSWNTGLRDQLEIVVLVDSPALRWELRRFSNTHYPNALSPTDLPPIIITQKDAEQPNLAEKYRGQDFVWQQYPGWTGVFPPDFINWFTFRQAPVSQSQVIVWARADIFPGGDSSTTSSTIP